jgi:hypothetical protein
MVNGWLSFEQHSPAKPPVVLFERIENVPVNE